MVLGAKADPGFTAASKVVTRVAREMWFLPTLGRANRAHPDALNGLELHELIKCIQAPDLSSNMLINWIQKCFRKFNIECMSATRWSIAGTEVDVMYSTRPMLLEVLATQWASSNKQELLDKTGFNAIDTEMIRKTYNSLPTKERRLLVQLLTDTVYTYARANSIGAEVDPECPLCGMKDSIDHRILQCPATCTDKPLPIKGSVRAAVFQEPWKTSTGLKSERTPDFFFYEVKYRNGHCSIKSAEPFHIPSSA
jgi:hypothetical protein